MTSSKFSVFVQFNANFITIQKFWILSYTIIVVVLLAVYVFPRRITGATARFVLRQASRMCQLSAFFTVTRRITDRVTNRSHLYRAKLLNNRLKIPKCNNAMSQIAKAENRSSLVSDVILQANKTSDVLPGRFTQILITWINALLNP